MMSTAPLNIPDQQYMSEPAKFLSKMSTKYQETCEWYRKWVTENPEVVSQVEKTFRVLSYCIAGFKDNSQILSEFVYSLANLLVFFNDSILRKASTNLQPKLTLSQHRLRRWLTILSHAEVFLELGSKGLWGVTGKWVVIAGVQILRTILRLVLLRRLKSGMQSSPPIQPLDRKKVHISPPSEEPPSGDDDAPLDDVRVGAPESEEQQRPSTFEGKRSGRVVRSLHATPDGMRRWKLPASNQPITAEELGETELAGFSLAAETLYISRPLVHLSCLFMWGWSSWKPWLLAIATDLASLELMKRDDKIRLNKKEKSELVNRRIMLLLYLLRSPCFNSFTHAKLDSLLQGTGETIPGARLITKPILDYLPVWQKIYSYNWGH